MLGALYIVRERKMDESKQWRTRNNKWTQVIIRYMKRTTHDIENTHVLNMFRRYSWIQSSYHRAHAYLQRRSQPRWTPTNVQQSLVCRAFSLCILSPTFDTRLANVRFKNNDGNYKTKKKRIEYTKSNNTQRKQYLIYEWPSVRYDTEIVSVDQYAFKMSLFMFPAVHTLMCN